MPRSTLQTQRRPRTVRPSDADPLDGLLSDTDRDAADPAALAWLRRLLTVGESAQDAEDSRPPAATIAG